MKNLRKLVFSAIMLVFALVAVVSSTLAWFTMQQEAEVNDIKLGAAADGEDLQISLREGPWGYAVAYNEFDGGQLTPVTFRATNTSFAKLIYNSENYKMEYATASRITEVTPGATPTTTGEYLAFTVYFQSANSKGIDLFFNLNNQGSAFTVPGGAETTILSSIRTMFVTKEVDAKPAVANNILSPSDELASYVIYEPNYNEDSTYGTGAFFKKSNRYVAEAAYVDFLEVDSEDSDKFVFKTANNGGDQYEAINDDNEGSLTPLIGTNNGIKIGSFTPGKILQVTVYIWLEGWDGDTNNKIALKDFTSLLKFTGLEAV